MAYGYFKTEGAEGVDYSFYSTQTGRIYTISFEMSLYVDYAQSFPTLVKEGHGLLFSFQKTREYHKDDRVSNIDSGVKETIFNILCDFLEEQPNTSFVVYECHDYKNSKMFSEWYKEFDDGKCLKKDGITLSTDDKEYNDIHFGFISLKENPLFANAQQELEAFGISFML